ncbi:hypothetical protein X801_10526, partial [Opisthorchis viverrini]
TETNLAGPKPEARSSSRRAVKVNKGLNQRGRLKHQLGRVPVAKAIGSWICRSNFLVRRLETKSSASIGLAVLSKGFILNVVYLHNQSAEKHKISEVISVKYKANRLNNVSMNIHINLLSTVTVVLFSAKSMKMAIRRTSKKHWRLQSKIEKHNVSCLVDAKSSANPMNEKGGIILRSKKGTSAFKVQRIQDWVKSPRVAAIVTHVESKQSVLFLFTGSRSAKGALVQLIPEELIGLNYAFQCEPMQSDQAAGPAVRLRIRGHRLTKTSMKRNSKSQVKVVRATGDGSFCGSNVQTDSDEPSEPVGVMYVTKVPQTEEVIQRLRKPKIWSCVLEFANAEEGARFRERTIYHAHQGGARSRNTLVNHPDSGNFEIGQDALKDAQAEQTDWLDKYRDEISRQKRDHMIQKSHLPSDGGPVNGESHVSLSTDSDSDVEKTTSTSSSSSEIHSSPGRVTDTNFSSVDNITQALSGHPSPTPTRPPPPIPSIRHYLSSSSLEPKESLSIPVDAKLQSSNSNNRVDDYLQPGTDSHVDQSLPYDSAKPQSLTASQSCSDILSGGTAPTATETRRKSKKYPLSLQKPVHPTISMVRDGPPFVGPHCTVLTPFES